MLIIFLIFSGLDAGGKLRPNAAELKELGPEFEARWKNYFENAPDKPVIWIGSLSLFVEKLVTFHAITELGFRFAGGLAIAPPRKYYGMAYYTVCSIHLDVIEC